MIKYIALTDWDGTVRRFFTLVSWMEFLSQNGLIDDCYYSEVDRYFKSYEEGNLGHDILVEKTALIYAWSLHGCSRESVLKLANNFITNDRKELFGFTEGLFRFFTENSLKVTVISGAPQEILEQYKTEFNLKGIYGLELSTNSDGFYDSGISQNNGLSSQKEAIIKLLLNGARATIGLGNSSSDIPLLSNSSLSIIIDNPDLNPGTNNIHVSSENINIADLASLISRELKQREFIL